MRHRTPEVIDDEYPDKSTNWILFNSFIKGETLELLWDYLCGKVKFFYFDIYRGGTTPSSLNDYIRFELNEEIESDSETFCVS